MRGTEFSGIIKIIVATIPFVVMSLRSSKINLKREFRGHQFLLPFLAIIYCIPAIPRVSQNESPC